MTNVILSSPAVDTGILSIARNALVEGVTKTGVVIENYSNMNTKYLEQKEALK